MKRIAFSTLASLAVSSLLGCSGVSDPGVTGNPGMTSVDSGSTSDTSTAPGDETSPLATNDTGTTPVGVDAGVDATLPGPDAAPDTGPVGPADAGATPDTGVVDAGADAGATFSCGAAMTCVTTAETCCVQATGGGGVTSTCQTGTVCPGGGTALHCTATADCATGMECCVVAAAGGGGMGGAMTSMCRAVCPNAQLCDPTAADPGCPAPAPNCMRPAVNGAGVGVRLPATVGTCQ